jgi:gluconokinase
VEILHAALESVALRFRNVYEAMEKAFGAPRELVGSGSALLHSQVWAQMMTDTLCHTMCLCLEPEATSRGAALLALERLGALGNLSEAEVRFGGTLKPDPARTELYVAALALQRRLYRKLFEEK